MNLDKRVEMAEVPSCCHICDGIIYVGDKIAISNQSGNIVAAHLECSAKLQDMEGK